MKVHYYNRASHINTAVNNWRRKAGNILYTVMVAAVGYIALVLIAA